MPPRKSTKKDEEESDVEADNASDNEDTPQDEESGSMYLEMLMSGTPVEKEEAKKFKAGCYKAINERFGTLMVMSRKLGKLNSIVYDGQTVDKNTMASLMKLHKATLKTICSRMNVKTLKSKSPSYIVMGDDIKAFFKDAFAGTEIEKPLKFFLKDSQSLMPRTLVSRLIHHYITLNNLRQKSEAGDRRKFAEIDDLMFKHLEGPLREVQKKITESLVKKNETADKKMSSKEIKRFVQENACDVDGRRIAQTRIFSIASSVGVGYTLTEDDKQPSEIEGLKYRIEDKYHDNLQKIVSFLMKIKEERDAKRKSDAAKNKKSKKAAAAKKGSKKGEKASEKASSKIDKKSTKKKEKPSKDEEEEESDEEDEKSNGKRRVATTPKKGSKN